VRRRKINRSLSRVAGGCYCRDPGSDMTTDTSRDVCPLCANRQWRALHRIADWTILECGACAFARVDPWPAAAGRPDFYSETSIDARTNTKRRGLGSRVAAVVRRTLRGVSGRSKATLFVRKLAANLKNGDRLLDIGCGRGAILRDIAATYRCSGVEISAYLADETRKLGVEVLTGDFQDIDFGGRRFHGITMVSLLEHLRDPVGALEKCHALLEDGGVLLLKTVNHAGLNRRLLGAKWSGYRPPDHLIYFGPDNLRALLRRLGFTRIECGAMPLNDSFYCDAWK
jgi:SAM-dependent methyltransferase